MIRYCSLVDDAVPAEALGMTCPVEPQMRRHRQKGGEDLVAESAWTVRGGAARRTLISPRRELEAACKNEVHKSTLWVHIASLRLRRGRQDGCHVLFVCRVEFPRAGFESH